MEEQVWGWGASPATSPAPPPQPVTGAEQPGADSRAAARLQVPALEHPTLPRWLPALCPLQGKAWGEVEMGNSPQSKVQAQGLMAALPPRSWRCRG